MTVHIPTWLPLSSICPFQRGSVPPMASVLTTPYWSLALKKMRIFIYHHTSAIALTVGTSPSVSMSLQARPTRAAWVFPKIHFPLSPCPLNAGTLQHLPGPRVQPFSRIHSHSPLQRCCARVDSSIHPCRTCKIQASFQFWRAFEILGIYSVLQWCNLSSNFRGGWP